MELKEAEDGSFIQACRQHAADCIDSIHFIIDELASQDPDVDEVIGRLANDFDVYLVKVPERKRCRLVVSVRYGSNPIVFVHAVVFSDTTRAVVENLVRNSLGLRTAVWEDIEH